MRDQRVVDRKVWVASVLFVFVGGCLALVASTTQSEVLFSTQVPWFLLAIGFAVCERYTLKLEVRRQVHMLSFTELPIVFGLLFVAPAEFVVVRMVVSVGTVVVVRRLPPVKLIFNAGVYATEAGLTLLLFRSFVADRPTLDSGVLLAVMVVIAISHVVTAAAVLLVMSLAGSSEGPVAQARLLGVSLTAAMAGAALAVGAAAAYESDQILVWIPLLLLGVALTASFVNFIRMRDRHQDLGTLHRFTSSLRAPDSSLALARVVVAGLAELLHAGRVTLLVPIDGVMARIEYTSSETKVSEQLAITVEEIDTVLDLAGHAIAEAGVGLDIGRTGVLATRLPLADAGGLIVVDSRSSTARAFDNQDLQMLRTAAGHAAAALHNAQLLTRLQGEAQLRAHHALHDDLTDLPNRRALSERLDEHLRSADRMVVFTVQVSELREVNATLGRASGDQLLTRVASRLASIRGEMAWTRTGTDEFTVLLSGGPLEADAVSRAIETGFRQPVMCDDVAISVRLGTGFVLAPTQGRTAELLLQRASLAAAWAGADGAAMSAWSPDRDPARAQQLRIAADLRAAIPAGELQVLFQPQLDMATGQVDGVEALVRWHHPRLGLLTPDRFIPAAENTGAIDALTTHVLEVAAEAGARWRAYGWDLDVAVNLSARSLTNARFSVDVDQILRASGLPPSSLTLELTESMVMTDSHMAMATLDGLQSLGISLAIDDFGTGYSSLAHLRRLSMAEIKIDKSFVLDLTNNRSDEVIVRSLIELGHNLGLGVTVEGVETVEVQRRVAFLGADRMQGYLLSRPLSESGFESWAHAHDIRAVDGGPLDRIIQLFPDKRG